MRPLRGDKCFFDDFDILIRMICHYEKELVHSDHIFNFGSQNDLGDFCVKKKLQWSVKKDFLSEARPYFNLGKQSSFRASLNLLAECKLF